MKSRRHGGQGENCLDSLCLRGETKQDVKPCRASKLMDLFNDALVRRITARVSAVYVLIAVVLIFMLLNPLSAAANDKVRLQLKWQHQFQFAGYYAAQAQGYYQAAGLEVEIIPSQPGEDPVQQVLGGKAEFGVGSTDLLLLREQGAPVVALAVIFQHSPLALMTLKQSGLQSIHDLAGRKIMIEPGSAELYAYLNREGISSDKFTLVPHSVQVKDLLAGNVDAMSAYVTDEPFELSEVGQAYLLYSPRAEGIDFYGDNLFTTEFQIKRKPKMVKAFRDASLKGWEYAMRHPEELAQLIFSRYSQRHSIEHLRFEAHQMAPLLQTELVEIGHMNPGRWRHIANTYADLGMMKPNVDLNGLIYDPNPVPPDLRWLYGVMGVAALVITLISALVVYIYRINVRLRRDASDRKRAELVLKNAMQFQQVLMDAVPSPIFYKNTQCAYIGGNKAFEHFVGLSPDQFIGKTAFDISPADLAEKYDKADRELLNNPGVQIYENSVVYADGTRHDVVFHKATFTNIEGKVEGMIGVILDITERRRMEEKLRESELQYRLLIETANEGIVVAQGDRFKFVNPMMLELTGYGEEELFSIPFIEFVHQDDRELIRNTYLKRLQGDAVDSRYSLRILKKDKSIKWVEISGAKMEWEGQPATINVVTDITARKQAEEALRESERFACSTVDALSAHLAILDEVGTILSVNRAWRQFAKNNSTNVGGLAEGANYLSVCDAEAGHECKDAVEFAAGIRGVLKGELDEFVLEYPCHSPTEKRWFIGRVTRFLGEGAIRLVVAHENITERKQVEEALQKALDDIKTLRGIVPICANCKKVRDDQGYWSQVEVYVSKHTEAEFSHGICPECAKKLYPGFEEDNKEGPIV